MHIAFMFVFVCVSHNCEIGRDSIFTALFAECLLPLLKIETENSSSGVSANSMIQQYDFPGPKSQIGNTHPLMYRK